MAVGLGGEQLWLSPTVANNVNPFDDQSGQGNNGTAVGGLSTITDTGSGGAYAYDFDGQNDYITYPIAAIDSANSIGSVSAWVKTGSTANPGGQIIGGSDTASTNAWSHLRLDSGEPTVVTNSSGQVGEKQSSTNVNDTNWHHVSAVGDGSNHSIYIDGTLVSSTWVGTNYGNRWLGYPAGMDTGLVGALVRSSGTGNLFDGQMDDIRAYNRVITQAEITHLASQRGVLGSPNNCGIITDLTYWSDLDDGLSSTLADDNGGSDVLTRNGGTTDATGSPRSSACVNYGTTVTNYHSLNGGANQPAPPSEYSVSIWCKFDTSSSVGNWVANQRDASTGDHWQIFRRQTGNIAVIESGSTLRSVETASSLNQWYHVSFSRSDAALSVYINGSLVGTDTASTVQNTASAPIAIGTPAWGLGGAYGHHNGKVWGFGMWDRVLTASEHSQLYQSGQGLLYSEICPAATTQYNAFSTHAFRQLFQQRIR